MQYYPCNIIVVIDETRNDINAREGLARSRMRKRVAVDARVLVFTQGQDDSCIRLITFFYGSCYHLGIVERAFQG